MATVVVMVVLLLCSLENNIFYRTIKSTFDFGLRQFFFFSFVFVSSFCFCCCYIDLVLFFISANLSFCLLNFSVCFVWFLLLISVRIRTVVSLCVTAVVYSSVFTIVVSITVYNSCVNLLQYPCKNSTYRNSGVTIFDYLSTDVDDFVLYRL